MIKPTNTLGPGIVIGIPTLGRPCKLDWAFAFKALTPPINYNVNFSVVYGRQVAEARNAIAKYAMEQDAKYLFFLGDDVIVPGHTLRQLIFRMENRPNIGIVGGVYCSKCDPPAPLVFMEPGLGSYWDWKIGEFFKCYALGMDCTLIRVDLLRELFATNKELFKTVDDDSHIDGQAKAEQWTEDLWFCNRVRNESSYEVWCDGSVICEHHDVWGGKTYRLPKDSYPLRQKAITNEKRVLMLGPSIDIVDAASYDITRCNDDKDADWRVSFDNLPFEHEQFDWTIITEPQSQLNVKFLEETKRVTKLAGRISINFTDFINREFVARFLGGKVDGTFVELGETGNVDKRDECKAICETA